MQLERFTQKAQEAIVAAQATAQRLDSPILDAEHILSALVEPDDGVPAETLRRLGVDLPGFRGELASILARRARLQGGSMSMDSRARRTIELAEKLGARVVDCAWRGYAEQKNRAAACAANDWILSLDADEALSEALEAEIWTIKKNGPRFDAYTMPRLAQYLGRWILHGGWYPDRKVRLYDRRKAEWTGKYVHESVRVNGRVGHLRENLLHFTCGSLSEHLKTLDRYTTLAAEELVLHIRALARQLFTDERAAVAQIRHSGEPIRQLDGHGRMRR